jgi:hypothetical protein
MVHAALVVDCPECRLIHSLELTRTNDDPDCPHFRHALAEATFRPQPDLGGLVSRLRHALRSRFSCVTPSEAGMATAEYAVATVAAAGFGTVLFKLLTSDIIREFLLDLLRQALSSLF